MSKAVCCVIPHDRSPRVNFMEPTLELDHEFADFTMIQFESYPQGVGVIQITAKFDETQLPIVQTVERISQM